MELSSRVTTEYKNAPLIEYLAGRFKYLSRDEWVERIKSGAITLNKELCQPDSVVKQGDWVTYNAPDRSPPRRDYTILFEDDYLLGVDKAPHLLVHASGPYIQENLIYQLRTWNEPPLPDTHLINRLDRETSGVILIAKGKPMLRIMSQQFAETAVQKTYLALVDGVMKKSNGVIERGILQLPKDDGPPKYVVSDAPEAKAATTHFELVEIIGETYSLVRLFPKTGRTHQLRVHMASIGHPIVGDKVYGRSSNIDRQLLHCHSNTFVHPKTEKKMTIAAPIPADMQAVIDEARSG